MINPATVNRSGMNDFTVFVRDNPGCIVRLRNGDIVQPEFKPAEDEYCSDSFCVGNYHHLYRWDVNGTGFKSRDYDMMEIVQS